MKEINFGDVYFHGFHDRCLTSNESQEIANEYEKLKHVLVHGLLSAYKKKTKGIQLPEDKYCDSNNEIDVFLTKKYVEPFNNLKNWGAGFDCYIAYKPSIIISRDVENMDSFRQPYNGIYKIYNEVPRSLFVGIGIPNHQLNEETIKMNDVKSILEYAEIDLPVYNTTTEERLI